MVIILLTLAVIKIKATVVLKYKFRKICAAAQAQYFKSSGCKFRKYTRNLI